MLIENIIMKLRKGNLRIAEIKRNFENNGRCIDRDY